MTWPEGLFLARVSPLETLAGLKLSAALRRASALKISGQGYYVCLCLDPKGWARMQITALSEAKGTLAVWFWLPSFKILPVSWCGTTKIKIHSTDGLHQLCWLTIDRLCVNPPGLYPYSRDWVLVLLVERNHFGMNVAAQHFLWKFLPKSMRSLKWRVLGLSTVHVQEASHIYELWNWVNISWPLKLEGLFWKHRLNFCSSCK